MEICRLCLSEVLNSNDILDIFNNNEHICSIISKHFWFEPKRNDKFSNKMCICCWEELNSFHNFYLKIEDVQKKLLTIKLDPFKADDNQEIKEEDLEIEMLDTDQYFDEIINETKDEDDNNCTIEYDDSVKTERLTTRSITLKFNKSDEIGNRTIDDSEKGLNKKVLKKTKLKKFVIRNKLENKTDSVIKPKEEKLEAKKRSDEIDVKITEFMKLFCDICLQEFKKFADIKTHFRTQHNMKGYVICCDKKYDKRIYLSDHIDCHLNPEEFKCHICNRVQRNHNALRQHIKVTHETPKAFECEICHKLMANKSALDLHKYTHIPEEERNFKCSECEKGFASDYQLKMHFLKVHESMSNNICHICGKTIKDAVLFKKHQLEHEGIVEPRVQCEFCGLWLKNQMSLKKHLRNLHDDPSIQHICPKCNKKCPTRAALKSHKFYVHSNKTYECAICKKEFKKAISLKEHMSTHTGEVLYTCPHCPKTFVSNANLHHHRKKDHRQEWEQKRANNLLKRSDPETETLK